MKTAADCFPCYVTQALRVARLLGCDKEKEIEVVKAVAALLPEMSSSETPPYNAIKVYETISRITGIDDPYKEVKQIENDRALEFLPNLRKEIACSENPFRLAIGFAIAGNIIDYGTQGTFSFDETLQKSRDASFSIDHRDSLINSVDSLQTGNKVLYLADNCGEIVYDSLVVELLIERGLSVTVAVKESPIINDATFEDARAAGLTEIAQVISNGTACPGTPITECSSEFRELFYEADLIISKGQGNFETLSEIDRDVFFFLTVKCKMVGKHLTEISGTENSLAGKGEMVVFHLKK